jgi:hypothetical protein
MMISFLFYFLKLPALEKRGMKLPKGRVLIAIGRGDCSYKQVP